MNMQARGTFFMELEKNFIHKNELIASAYAQATVEDDYNLPDYKPDLMKMIDAVGEVELEETKSAARAFLFREAQIFGAVPGRVREKRDQQPAGEIPFREKSIWTGGGTGSGNSPGGGCGSGNQRDQLQKNFPAVRAGIPGGMPGNVGYGVPVAVPDGTDYEVKMSDRQVLQLLETRRDVLRMRQGNVPSEGEAQRE